ncbi:hypothetical protein ASG70_06175 [Phycicoccus sp. Soil748]|nr:hypothetical protein ASG70_06175 [Phycicoccus sp. Soil748]
MSAGARSAGWSTARGEDHERQRVATDTATHAECPARGVTWLLVREGAEAVVVCVRGEVDVWAALDRGDDVDGPAVASCVVVLREPEVVVVAVAAVAGRSVEGVGREGPAHAVRASPHTRVTAVTTILEPTPRPSAPRPRGTSARRPGTAP